MMKNFVRNAAKIVGTVFLLYCSACNPKQNIVSRDMNGFILGDDSAPPPVFTVGIGDGLNRFFEKNPFLSSLKPAEPLTKLSLPIMKTVDATYDDDSIRFHVGCATTTNIEGDVKANGINIASFYLCRPSLDDWQEATHNLETMINTFASQNKNISSLREFRRHHSLEESSARWETDLIDRYTKQEFPLSEHDANQFLRTAAESGHVQQLRLQQGSSVLMEAFASERLFVFFEIAKMRNRGGDNLTVAEKSEMKYQAVVTFRKRAAPKEPLI